MIKIIREEEKEEYSSFMDVTACALYKNSMSGLMELKEHHTPEEILKNDTEALSKAVGQIVLDKVIDLTKDMSKEDLIRWLAQSSSSYLLVHMNRDEGYRQKIRFISQFL